MKTANLQFNIAISITAKRLNVVKQQFNSTTLKLITKSYKQQQNCSIIIKINEEWLKEKTIQIMANI